MNYLTKILFRAALGLCAFSAIWYTSYSAVLDESDRVFCHVAYIVPLVVPLIASRYSRLERWSRRIALAFTAALPFLRAAAISFPGVFDNIFAPLGFWSACAAAMFTASLAADSVLPGWPAKQTGCQKR